MFPFPGRGGAWEPGKGKTLLYKLGISGRTARKYGTMETPSSSTKTFLCRGRHQDGCCSKKVRVQYVQGQVVLGRFDKKCVRGRGRVEGMKKQKYREVGEIKKGGRGNSRTVGGPIGQQQPGVW